ncbi:MAG: hypothetical protein ABW321_11820, partial [Polyangiales bacterium]
MTDGPTPTAPERRLRDKLLAQARRPRVFVALIGLVYLGLGLWSMRPLPWQLGNALSYGTTPKVQPVGPVAPSDSHQLLFYNWLFVDNVRSGRSPVANVYEFGPLDPRDLHTLGLWAFPMQLVFWLLLPFGMLTAYNLQLILSFPLTGLAQYGFARRLGAARPAAFLAGLVLAFAVSRKQQMVSGHANGFLYLHL